MVRSCYGTYCPNLERTRNHSKGWGHVAWNGKTHGLLAKNGCGIMEAKASTPISRIRGCDETSILVNGYLVFSIYRIFTMSIKFQRRTGVTGQTLIVWGDDEAEHLMLEKQEVMTKTFDRRGKIKIGLVGDWKRRVNK